MDDQSAQLLSTTINQSIQQGQMDDLAPVASRSTTPVLLDDLFDFSRADWVPHHQRTSRRSLDEELLDVDLPDDDTTGEILTLSV